MTRTADDDHGYGGDAPAYDEPRQYCPECRADIAWPEPIARHRAAHVAARVLALEIEDAPYAELARELRRERDMRRGGRPE